MSEPQGSPSNGQNRRPAPKGRGAQGNPANRFLPIIAEADLEHLEFDEEGREALVNIRTEYYDDQSKSILSRNDSPDLPFRYSLNPYRGCAHGCSYCYARPTHEYFGLSAGLDFETKIFVKKQAPALFRNQLASSQWHPEAIMMSGVTDCYQPAERRFRLTRGCLEVALEARQPLSIVTKNALVTRDLDLLREMAQQKIVSVALSMTSLDQSLTRVLEPRTSSPAARLRAVRQLSEAGVPVTVMVAPIVPGLNDTEIPAILEAARDHGATCAHYILLRLPLTVRPVFLEWLEQVLPDKKSRVETLVQATRDGNWNSAKFGTRMKGTGEIADQIRQTFSVFARRFGLDRREDSLDFSRFRPPVSTTGQRRLF